MLCKNKNFITLLILSRFRLYFISADCNNFISAKRMFIGFILTLIARLLASMCVRIGVFQCSSFTIQEPNKQNSFLPSSQQ